MGTKLILSDGIKENKRGCQGQKDKVEELKDSYIRQIMRLAMTKQWPKAWAVLRPIIWKEKDKKRKPSQYELEGLAEIGIDQIGPNQLLKLLCLFCEVLTYTVNCFCLGFLDVCT